MSSADTERSVEREAMSNYAHETVPTQFVETKGIRYAYRRFGSGQNSEICLYWKGGSMKTTIEQNKRFVLEAFDTLFNKRDYAGVEKFWSPNYIQHSAHIEPGREGLFNLVKSLPPMLKYEDDCRRRRLRDC